MSQAHKAKGNKGSNARRSLRRAAERARETENSQIAPSEGPPPTSATVRQSRPIPPAPIREQGFGPGPGFMTHFHGPIGNPVIGAAREPASEAWDPSGIFLENPPPLRSEQLRLAMEPPKFQVTAHPPLNSRAGGTLISGSLPPTSRSIPASAEEKEEPRQKRARMIDALEQAKRGKK